MKLSALILTVIAALAPLPSVAAAPVYVGVYEPEHTDPAAGADAFDSKTNQYIFKHGKSRIRVAFMFRDGRWQAMSHKADTESELKAIAAASLASLTFHDLETGKFDLKTQRSNWDFYGYLGSYELTAPLPPALLHPSKKAGDWNGTYRYAPFIVTTAEGAKTQPSPAVTLTPQQMGALAQALRQQEPTYTFCKEPETKIGEKPWQNSDVRAHALRSASGILASVALDSKLDKCEFDDAGKNDSHDNVVNCDYCSHWYLLTPDGRIRPLGNSMAFIGSGDFTGDGKVEWLFAQSAENYDSYVLFADDFATRLVFSWSYH